jgi:hypothetical protein
LWTDEFYHGFESQQGQDVIQKMASASQQRETTLLPGPAQLVDDQVDYQE